jgi:hypothetical protein
MIAAHTRTESDFRRVGQAAHNATLRNLQHAAALLRRSAIAGIKRSKRPSDPGEPVHTRAGLAKRAILFAADQEEAVIGFSYQAIGIAMQAHEHGGRRGADRYPPRPTMQPALEKVLPRFAADWAHSIG